MLVASIDASSTKCTQGLPGGINDGKPGITTVTGLVESQMTGSIYAAFYAVGTKDVAGVYLSEDHGGSWRCINQGFATGVKPQAAVEQIDRYDANLVATGSAMKLSSLELPRSIHTIPS